MTKPAGTRRPKCDTLFDVFKNICDDEAEHVKTMAACQDYARIGKLVESPHVQAAKNKSKEKKKDEAKWIRVPTKEAGGIFFKSKQAYLS